jgi:2-polyprenyl-6-methoxyphenol hydroxylase-like FAD-dependent oxidoreductase
MSTQSSQLDVLIIGAGPVGLTLALACARQGLTFRIIEKLAAPSPYSKALAIWPGTLEILAGLGVVEDFLADGMQFDCLKLHDMGKHLGTIHPSEGIDSHYPHPLFLPQSKTEALLTKTLTSLGHTIERGMELTHIGQTDDHVFCKVSTESGAETAITARYAVGCDGARSVVRHQIPVQFEGVTVETNMILGDVALENPPEKVQALVNWTPTGPLVIFPVEPGVWRIFTTRTDLNNSTPPTLEELQQTLEKSNFGHFKPHSPTWLSAFRINERVTNRMRVGRIFLSGDAAHIHSPAGGQGMNTGMQDAYNLAWKLKLLVQGVADPEAVAESYQQERHPVAVSVVEGTAKLLRTGLQSQNSGFRRFVRDTVLSVVTHIPAFQHFAATRLSELNIEYTHSGLIRSHGSWVGIGDGFLPGTRPRDAAIQTRDGKTSSLWSLLLAGRYTLLAFPGVNMEPQSLKTITELAEALQIMRPDAQVIGLWPGYTPPAPTATNLTWVRDFQTHAHAAYGVSTDPAWCLIRPDQYLAARSQPANVRELVEALAPIAIRHAT